jgi:hypothetical protein
MLLPHRRLNDLMTAVITVALVAGPQPAAVTVGGIG